MKLVIQTNVAGRLLFWLVAKGSIQAKLSKIVQWHGSDVALQAIDTMLKKNKKTLSGIVVVRGPGSFTAVRTGLIIANTLASLLDLPVYGVVHTLTLTDSEVLKVVQQEGKRRTLIKPWYGKSPNITKSKKKLPQARAKR